MALTLGSGGVVGVGGQGRGRGGRVVGGGGGRWLVGGGGVIGGGGIRGVGGGAAVVVGAVAGEPCLGFDESLDAVVTCNKLTVVMCVIFDEDVCVYSGTQLPHS